MYIDTCNNIHAHMCVVNMHACKGAWFITGVVGYRMYSQHKVYKSMLACSLPTQHACMHVPCIDLSKAGI